MKQQAPNEKIAILIKILKFLFAITLTQGLFQIALKSFSIEAIGFFASTIVYWLSWKYLSYFGCLINQVFNIAIIFVLLIEMAKKLQDGLYSVYLSSNGIYKMLSLIFCIICIYFNFAAYQSFKSLALEIIEFEDRSNSVQEE